MKKFILLFTLMCIVCVNIADAQHPAVGPRLTGKKLIVGITDDPPYTMKDEEGKWVGLNVDLWANVVRDLKIDYEFKEMTLDEILTALHKNKIDLTIMGLFVTTEREKLFDFTVPIGSSRMGVITLPHAIDHPWWSAIRVFLSWGILKVVIVLVCALIVIGFLFWLIERKNNPEHFGGGFIKGLCTGIYWVGATMASGVCFGVNIRSTSGRILALVWMFICAVILSAFIASLASSLTLDELTSSAVDKHALRKMKLGVLRGGTSSRVLQQMGGRSVLFDDGKDALKAVLEKKIDGFLYDETTLYYISDREYPGKFTVYSTNLKRFQFAFGVPMGSTFRKPINAAMLNTINDPLWEIILDKYGFKENFEKKPISSRKRRN